MVRFEEEADGSQFSFPEPVSQIGFEKGTASQAAENLCSAGVPAGCREGVSPSHPTGKGTASAVPLRLY